ncbi:hypothetical protein [Massilia sp. S19_KUP03_FR1]|uniref:hypothetical protein n=1 Tax=Massilia sp. S19_KUP03_FR1 TaxID=3025503 RepID=UPI002FCD81DF
MSETTTPPEDRYCDLIMKGGISSGIVYPKAVALLARRYRFRSIGGTSAGAMAAALTAAAELNRRQNHTLAGFDMLSALPEDLQGIPGSKHSALLELFQAQTRTRRLFSVLLWALNREGTGRRIGASLVGLVLQYWPATVASLALAGLIGHCVEWVAGILTLLLALLSTIGIWVYVDLVCGMVKNGFGLCSGMPAGTGKPALTPWLHEQIQRIAGLKPGDAPLTFGQLWSADGFPPAWLEIPPPPMTRSIDLQVFSTNLGLGRPCILPLSSNDPPDGPARERLYFNAAELAHYLPEEVLNFLTITGAAYQPTPGAERIDPLEADALRLGLRELPKPKEFPVLLAARMSLSFPFLLSAIPLWSIERKTGMARGAFRRCWFSDGGISSNFPIHLFDSLLPMWPTFGINLEDYDQDTGNETPPPPHLQEREEQWQNFDEQSSGRSRLGGFLVSIVHAMQNWNDNVLAHMPGVRDRIVQVPLMSDEGGLNLDMPREKMNRVSKRGQKAAACILQHFDAADPRKSPAPGWDAQRLVRLAVLLQAIEARIPGLAQALDPLLPYVTDYITLINRAEPDLDANNLARAKQVSGLTLQQIRDIRRAWRTWRRLARSGAKLHNARDAGANPELRVRPPL